MKGAIKKRQWALVCSYTAYEFDGYEVIHFTADKNSYWRFDNDPSYTSTIGAYYRGAMRATDAKDPEVVGTVYRGFWDFRDPTNLKHNTPDSWINCVIDEPTDWFCVHSLDPDMRLRHGLPSECPAGWDLFEITPELGLFIGRESSPRS